MESHVTVKLENANGVYISGEIIKGYVECIFVQPHKVKGVFIKFRGRAKTKITEHKGRNTTEYKGVENYFLQEFNLLQNLNDETILPDGKHVYPFSYIIPPVAPSSFEGSNGNIRYSIKATVDRPWRFNFKHKIRINVLMIANFNLFPELHCMVIQPATLKKTKNVGCFTCKSGSLEIVVILPNSAFIYKTPKTFHVNIDNQSTVNCTSLRFKIIRKIDYTAVSKSRTEYKTLTKWHAEGVSARSEKLVTTTHCLKQHYPTLVTCAIIKANYFLRVEAVLPIPYLNLKIMIPIIVGDIPLAPIPTKNEQID